MSEYVASLAEQYFSTLNPIAARLHSDITDTKNAYEKLWDQLSPEEQSQIIDESIIKPEVTLKYGIKTAPESKKGQNYGQKIIHDENFVYRDEFSAPFSYKTQSQMDLRVFSESPVVLPGSPLLKSSQLVQVKLHPKKEKEICVEPAQIIIDDPGKYDETDLHCNYSDSGSKNSSPTETLNETPSSDISQDEKACLLPNDLNVKKTGYDFLDNW